MPVLKCSHCTLRVYSIFTCLTSPLQCLSPAFECKAANDNNITPLPPSPPHSPQSQLKPLPNSKTEDIPTAAAPASIANHEPWQCSDCGFLRENPYAPFNDNYPGLRRGCDICGDDIVCEAEKARKKASLYEAVRRGLI